MRFINAPTEYVVLWRGIIGSLTILPVMLIRREPPDMNAIRKNLKTLICSGFCLGFNWVFLFAAYKQTTVAIASLLNYMAPMTVIVLSPVLFKTKLTVKTKICAASAFLGIILVSGVLEANNGNFNPLGIFLGVMSAVGFVGITICNRSLKDIRPLDKTIAQLFFSILIVFPYVKIVDPDVHLWNLDTRSILLIIMLGVFQTGIAYILYFGGLGVLPVQTFSLLSYLEPVESVLLSALVLHEPISPLGILGTIMIIGAAAYNEVGSE